MSDELGYMVISERPSIRSDSGDSLMYDSVGGIHHHIEPCLNHQAYCEGMAEQDPARYGAVKYSIVRVTRVNQDNDSHEGKP